ncbi:MAG: hypothetical protein LBQ56_00465, partial [Synergistaceae bacterium]|nr:hypothetical protein [Synergistaceae bacterium]
MKKNFSGGARGGKETGGSGGRRGRRAVPGGRGETEAPRPRRRIGAHSGGRAKPEAPRLENRRDRADRDENFSREDSSSDFCWGRNPVISLLED